MRQFYAGLLAVLCFSSLPACSFQSTLDKMVKPERQREIIDIAQRFCTDPTSVKREMHREITATLDAAIPALPRECPPAGARWELASYKWNSNVTAGLSERQEEVVVVGSAPGKWSTVEVRFYARNDEPARIVYWRVIASKTRPPALEFIEGYNRTVEIARIAVPVALLAIAALVVWLVRRQRAKRAA